MAAVEKVQRGEALAPEEKQALAGVPQLLDQIGSFARIGILYECEQCTSIQQLLAQP